MATKEEVKEHAEEDHVGVLGQRCAWCERSVEGGVDGYGRAHTYKECAINLRTMLEQSRATTDRLIAREDARGTVP